MHAIWYLGHLPTSVWRICVDAFMYSADFCEEYACVCVPASDFMCVTCASMFMYVMRASDVWATCQLQCEDSLCGCVVEMNHHIKKVFMWINFEKQVPFALCFTVAFVLAFNLKKNFFTETSMFKKSNNKKYIKLKSVYQKCTQFNLCTYAGQSMTISTSAECKTCSLNPSSSCSEKCATIAVQVHLPHNEARVFLHICMPCHLFSSVILFCQTLFQIECWHFQRTLLFFIV